MATSSSVQKSFPVIDADSHVVEPQAIWEHYLEPEYRVVARSSFWHERDEIGPHTVLNGRPAPELSTATMPRYAIWQPGMTLEQIGEMDPGQQHPMSPGATDPSARLRDMDEMGVDQALIFPTLFAEYFPLVENPDVAHALARAYNDWLMDFCGADSKRLIPVAVLPMQDVNFAVREARRAAAAGFKAAFIRPVFFNNRFPADVYYRPLWGELEALGLLACAHPSAGPAAAELDANAPFVERVTSNLRLGHPVAEVIAPSMDTATLLIAMLADGLMEKFPKLKLHFAHSGSAWLPLALEKTETYLWICNQAELVSLDPAGVFYSRQNLVSFCAGDTSVRHMPSVYESVGAWGSRYPNQDTTTAWEAIRDLESGGVPPVTIERLLGGNIAGVLGTKPPSKAKAAS